MKTETELIVTRTAGQTVWCVFSVRQEKGRERHDMVCWSDGPRGIRAAALPDMGSAREKDRAFFLAFAGSDPDPSFLFELFEDR